MQWGAAGTTSSLSVKDIRPSTVQSWVEKLKLEKLATSSSCQLQPHIDLQGANRWLSVAYRQTPEMWQKANGREGAIERIPVPASGVGWVSRRRTPIALAWQNGEVCLPYHWWAVRSAVQGARIHSPDGWPFHLTTLTTLSTCSPDSHTNGVHYKESTRHSSGKWACDNSKSVNQANKKKLQGLPKQIVGN